MPTAFLKKLPKTAQHMWESTYKSAKAKYGSSSAAAIATSMVKKHYKQVGGKYVAMSELALESKELTFSTEKLMAHAEGSLGEVNYYMEGYVAKSEITSDNNYFTPEALKDAAEQIKKMPLFTGDLEHINPVDGTQLVNPNTQVETKEEVIKALDAYYDSNGLFIKAILNKNVKNFPQIWNKIQNGIYNGFSIVAYGDKNFSRKEFINNNIVTMWDKIKPIKFTLTSSPKMKGARANRIYKSS